MCVSLRGDMRNAGIWAWFRKKMQHKLCVGNAVSVAPNLRNVAVFWLICEEIAGNGPDSMRIEPNLCE